MLKRLELMGFKSFPQKTTFEFADGITAVVGPNGCGKSNVSDAIRWVLGEQRTKSLRGEKMEDFIFSGTQNKKAMNVAEVAITLDNSSGFIHLDYEEISVKRRFYRSGESEYFINNNPCRLKDVQEIFMDTGIGKETYSIISQGELDKILTANPQERRYLFEEAAGILKYKLRKREALNKLEDTKTNLARVYDIIEELTNQEKPLRAQADEARKYYNLQKALKTLEVNLFCHTIEEKRAKWEDVNEKQEKSEQNLLQLRSKTKKLSGYLQEYKTQLTNLEKDLEMLQREHTNLISQKEKNQSQAEIAYERLKNTRQEKKRLLGEKNQLNQDIHALKIQLEQSNNKKDQLAREKEKEKNKLRVAQDKLAQLTQEDAHLEEQKSSLIEVINAKQRANTQKENLQREKTRLEQEISESQAKLQELQNNSKSLYERQKNLEKKKEEAEKEQNSLNKEIEMAREQVNQQEKERAKVEDELQKLYQDISSLKSRAQMLEELDGNGFSKGVQAVLKKKQKEPENWKKVLGTVSQLISVKRKYTQAIETALGGAVQNIVTEDDRTAQNLLEYLKNEKLGRATCLPLKQLSPRYLNQYQKQVIAQHDIEGFANELIDVKNRYQLMADYLLGRVIVVKNLDFARRLARALKFSLKLVTLEGELILPGGAMVGGATANRNNKNILSMEDKNELEKRIDEAKELTKHYEEKRQSFQDQIKRKKDQIKTLYEKIEKQKLDYQENKMELEQLKKEKAQIKEESELIGYKLKEKQSEYDNIKSQLEENCREIETFGNQEKEFKEKIHHLEQQLKQDEEYQQLNQIITEHEVNLGKLDERLENVNSEGKTLQQRLAKLEHNKLPAYINSIAEAEAKMASISRQRKEIRNKERELNNKEQQISWQIDDLKEKKQGLQSQIETLESKQKEYSAREKELEKETSDGQMHKNRLETEIRNALDRLKEKYHLNYQEAKAYMSEISDYKSHKEKINEVQQELEKLGEVNLGAIKEHERVKNRLTFLKAQRSDLEAAEKSLKKLLLSINTTMRDSFAQTLHQIDQAFQRVFNEIYGGGSAYLKYTDENNLLDTGIEIVAKPPGKKKQVLSLLSSGERALTVIALFFAIHETKPSPFCVLDEVDASLDETNLNVLTEFLRNFAARTQFIVITHRKQTMLAADRFYGVTMSEPGVSQLVSVEFDREDIESA